MAKMLEIQGQLTLSIAAINANQARANETFARMDQRFAYIEERLAILEQKMDALPDEISAGRPDSQHEEEPTPPATNNPQTPGMVARAFTAAHPQAALSNSRITC